ncbi:MAG: hypothetical protein MI975_09975 [Cytophagales bacterium]|nr:hypothetical protein [Cytophagales bacterium]
MIKKLGAETIRPFFVYVDMNFTINLKPYPAAHYFTVQEHAHKYPGDDYTSEDVQRIEKILRAFMGLSPDYHFGIVKRSRKDRYMAGFGSVIRKDDPESGIDYFKEGARLHSGGNILDLSYSFPQINGHLDDFDAVIIDPNMSLGIPSKLVIVFHKNLSANKEVFDRDDSDSYSNKDLHLLSGVLADLKAKGLELLIRESNYKAAVLYQLMDSSERFQAVAPNETRSKTMIVAETSEETASQISRLGYEINEGTKDGAPIISIANYMTHSKELIEMFSDRISLL